MKFRLILALVLVVSLASGGHAILWWSEDGDQSFAKQLDRVVSFLIGQKSEDFATPEWYSEFLLQDNTNEDLVELTPQQILTRSGFAYKNHYVESDDGYITQLIRIINPLADQTKLKQPPVTMFHGGVGDPVTWYWSNAIQHHPEKWPRTVKDGPMTSWNKSLAFVLANNGYDVWMVGTRGCNLQNKRHTNLKHHLDWFDQQELAKMGKSDINAGKFVMNFEENFRYWNYTMDDLGRHEVPRQVEKVLELTGASNITLINLSLATTIDFALMSENAHFNSRLHNLVSMSPILTNRGTNLAIKGFHETICTKLPLPLGIILSQVLLSQPLRNTFVLFNSFKELRYSIIKQVTRVVAGPSSRFETNLDSAVVGQILKSFSFKELRHYCQQMIAGHLQKYDYGPVDNLRLYGSLKPPKYDLSKIELPNWVLITGGNDMLATKKSADLLLASVKRQPNKRIHVERYNHQDLLAAVEVDKYVNLPVLEFLDQFAWVARDQNEQEGKGEKVVDMISSTLPKKKVVQVKNMLDGELG